MKKLFRGRVKRVRHAHRAHWVNRWDRIGILLSGLCMVHCLILPVFFLLLPFLQAGGKFLAFEQLHVFFVFFLPLVAFLAFIPGYRTHRNSSVLWLGVSGIACIFLGYGVGQVLPAQDSPTGHLFWESLITSIGSALLVWAHWRNQLRCAGCEVIKN